MSIYPYYYPYYPYYRYPSPYQASLLPSKLKELLGVPDWQPILLPLAQQPKLLWGDQEFKPKSQLSQLSEGPGLKQKLPPKLLWDDQELLPRLKLTESQLSQLSGDQEFKPKLLLTESQQKTLWGDHVWKPKLLPIALFVAPDWLPKLRLPEFVGSTTPTSDSIPLWKHKITTFNQYSLFL